MFLICTYNLTTVVLCVMFEEGMNNTKGSFQNSSYVVIVEWNGSWCGMEEGPSGNT